MSYNERNIRIYFFVYYCVKYYVATQPQTRNHTFTLTLKITTKPIYKLILQYPTIMATQLHLGFPTHPRRCVLHLYNYLSVPAKIR